MSLRETIVALFLLLGAGVSLVLAQEVDRLNLKHAADLAALFPEVPGCVKVVTATAPAPDNIQLEIKYEPRGYEERKRDSNYSPCGSITLHRAPGSGKPRERDQYDPLVQKVEIQGREGWQLSPMCGNDPWLGSIELLLSEDQVIEFNAMVGAEAILEFANDADLALIADRMRIWMR